MKKPKYSLGLTLDELKNNFNKKSTSFKISNFQITVESKAYTDFLCKLSDKNTMLGKLNAPENSIRYISLILLVDSTITDKDVKEYMGVISVLITALVPELLYSERTAIFNELGLFSGDTNVHVIDKKTMCNGKLFQIKTINETLLSFVISDLNDAKYSV